MKLLRCVSSLVLACLLLAGSMVPALAAEAPTDSEVIYFEDGSYLVRRLFTAPTTRTSNTTSGTICGSYYSSADVLLCEVFLTGTFTYDGTTATATQASYDYKIYDTAWSFKSGRAYCSGDQAIAEVKFTGGIFITRTAKVVITCSPDGKLS